MCDGREPKPKHAAHTENGEAAGNINPALQVAKLLHRHVVYVTFVNTEHNHRVVQYTEGAATLQGCNGFRFETIPDGLSEADRAKQDYGTSLAESIISRCAAPFRALVTRLNGGDPGVPRVTCVLATLLWKQDGECLAWLDTQAPGSVVYANFGSMTVVTSEQLTEFAWGPAASGHPFLWSIRDDLVRGGGGGGLAALPPDFTAETAGRCRLSPWCSQELVLRHPAVGCFVTHSGWNLTTESLAAGVPMVCWPGFADQYTNCRCVCEARGVGVRLDAEVRRDQVAQRVREVMESDEMRRNAARWKAEAAAATSPGGSSQENLLATVTALSRSADSSQT
ncbi:unnamed protein product [Urochloa decumbens]|uniref:UDP-glycosyltransferases domain-containing protein n=1 Tax=Urochloa decumbens TaxID=240449 RepID=A0ABC9A4A8_9POAL